MVEKLKITPLMKQPGEKGFKRLLSQEITVLFNPETYSITKSVTWSGPKSSEGASSSTDRKVNAPILTYGGGGSRQLTMELLFDVTDPRQINWAKPVVPDVRHETNKIVALTRMRKGEQGKEEPPPVCEVSWGKAPIDSDFPFIGVLTGLTQKFTLFAPNGNPLRATLNVTFLEFLDPEQDQRKTDPELTTYLVKRGESLSTIAAAVYGDPTVWRVIADANRLSNPRNLEDCIGKRLTIPKLG